jgi:dTDP-glucose 4,6-dehydratase
VKVVITGGAGFIGSNLVHHWHRVHPEDMLVVYDLLTYAGHRESLRDIEHTNNYEFVHGDILDSRLVRETLDGAELVVHLAAETHNDRAIFEPKLFVRTNVEGTATLLEGVRHAGVRRFHHVSTDEVFGSLELTDPGRFTTNSLYRPRSPYAASKAAADHLVRAWGETYGIDYTISNCGNNFGPYQHPEKLIPMAITRLLRGQPVPIYGDGLNVRDWIFVQDHCEAIDLIAHRGRPKATYLISAECEKTNIDIVTRLLKALARDAGLLRHVADRPGHDRRYSLDPSQLKSELGWRANTAFDDGIQKTVEWYRSNETWWRPFLREEAPPGV